MNQDTKDIIRDTWLREFIIQAGLQTHQNNDINIDINANEIRLRTAMDPFIEIYLNDVIQLGIQRGFITNGHLSGTIRLTFPGLEWIIKESGMRHHTFGLVTPEDLIQQTGFFLDSLRHMSTNSNQCFDIFEIYNNAHVNELFAIHNRLAVQQVCQDLINRGIIESCGENSVRLKN